MKRKNLWVLAAAVGGMMAASGADAASISFGGYTGPIFMKYGNFDVGRLYPLGTSTPVLPGAAGATAVDLVPGATPPSGTPVAGASNPAEDSWGIAFVTEIHAGTNALAPLIYQRGNPAFQGDTEVTAIFFGGRDIQVTTSGTQETVYGDSFQIGVYASEFGNALDGPDLSLTPDATDRGNVGLLGSPTFSGITTGTLMWSFVGAPGEFASNPSAEFQSTIDLGILNGPLTGAVVGTGSLFLEKSAIDLNGDGIKESTGAQNDVIGSLLGDPDASVQFTVRQPPTGSSWTVSSDDPFLSQVVAVPLPAAAYAGVALFGWMGLNGRKRRARW